MDKNKYYELFGYFLFNAYVKCCSYLSYHTPIDMVFNNSFIENKVRLNTKLLETSILERKRFKEIIDYLHCYNFNTFICTYYVDGIVIDSLPFQYAIEGLNETNCECYTIQTKIDKKNVIYGNDVKENIVFKCNPKIIRINLEKDFEVFKNSLSIEFANETDYIFYLNCELNCNVNLKVLKIERC